MASGEVILAPGGEKIVADRSFYASFVTPVEYTVECAGERIGVLPADNVPQPDEAILLAGAAGGLKRSTTISIRSSWSRPKAKRPRALAAQAGRSIRKSCRK
jgi:hypothetical protein